MKHRLAPIAPACLAVVVALAAWATFAATTSASSTAAPAAPAPAAPAPAAPALAAPAPAAPAPAAASTPAEAAAPASAPAGERAQLMRYADVSADHVAFTYEDDLWLAPVRGGQARRLTTGQRVERGAKFSPDGRWLAFTANYDGEYDVYVMPVEGGPPRRLTYNPGADLVIGWHPDGKRILFRSGRQHPMGVPEFYLVSRDGGLAEKVPIDRGALGSYSPDGGKLAYNRIATEARTWKRYQGGMAPDIWIADLTGGTFEKITDWVGTDDFPMWWGQTIYFDSDREDGTLNLYAYDTTTRQTRRLTHYTEYDVKYPSLGAGRIIYQLGGDLHLYDVASGADAILDIDVNSDRAPMRPELVAVAPRVGSFSLSPAGERVLLEDRGEILNLPVKDGAWFDVTRASGSREKNAAWSPDGRWICFTSDRTGEEQLYLADQRGQDPWRQLTQHDQGLLLPPVWSPDSKSILFGDKFLRLNLVDVANGKTTVVDQGKYDDTWERWGILDYVWSPDGHWVAYSKQTDNMNEVICLYNVTEGRVTQLTDNFFESWSPSFAPDGKHLWFLSNRTFNPIMGRVDQNDVFLDMALPYVVVLRAGERSPFFKDEGLVTPGGEGKDKGEQKEDRGGKGEKAKEAKGGKAAKEKEEAGAKATRVDLDGIRDRIVAAEGVKPANYFRLEATEDGCLMLRRDKLIFMKYQNVDDRTSDEDLTLVAYGVKDKETKDLCGGLANYHRSADGKKLVYRAGASYGVVDASQPFKTGDGAVPLKDVSILVDRAAEYKQIFWEAWRIERDFFYDPDMHGVDWPRMGKKYATFLPSCGARGDLTYLIGEMISELNIGHTYVYGGDYQGEAKSVGVGLLGCDFALDPASGRYRIARILPGRSWDPQARSPLTEPGVDVREGDFLLAVDGVALRAGTDPLALLVDKAGKLVELTVATTPDGKGSRTALVRPLGGESTLRYRAWVEANRRYVDEKSGGRIGYLHLPNMTEPGLIEFGEYWYPQFAKRAFIIDERYNGGGFVGDMIIDRLARKLWSLTIPREGGTARDPERCFYGPFAVLVNENTGSNGEFFAQAIQLQRLAPVIGMRTWGGAIGIEPHEDLVDGGVTTPPQFGLYGLDGKWLYEGHGIDPDIEIQNAPARVVAGKDDQLDKAIAELLGRLEREGAQWTLPPVPPYPDKSKPGEGVRR